jgi:hypothetical protein
MGMNLLCLVAQAEKVDLIKHIEEVFEIKLSYAEKAEWIDYDGGVYDDDKIIIYSNNNATLVYLSNNFFHSDLEHAYRSILRRVNKGCAFFASETSMAFGLLHGEHKRVIAEDYYLFEEKFTQKGPNLLQLGEDNDIIWDGIFPTITAYVGEMEEETLVEVYHFSVLEDEEEEQEDVATQSSAAPKIDNTEETKALLAKVEKAINNLAYPLRVNNGYTQVQELYRMEFCNRPIFRSSNCS